VEGERQQRPRRGNKSYRIGLVLVVLLAAWLAWSLLGGSLLPEGSPAPAWTLPRADRAGESLSLSDLVGDVVVLDFWSTTCPPCLRQMEDLKLVWRRMKPRGVTVVGISTGGEPAGQIAQFGGDRGVDYPLVVDPGGTSTAYQVRTLPTLYVIDRSGRVAASHSGYWPATEIAAAVTAALEDHSSSTVLQGKSGRPLRRRAP
jgi:peroxiredoxin